MSVENYKSLLEGQLLTAKQQLARAESAVKKIALKLENVDRAYNKELKRGGKKVSKLAGVAAPAKSSPKPKDNEPDAKLPKENSKKGFMDGLFD